MYAIPLKVSSQNAGILAYRHEAALRLEMFELSPQNNSVIGTIGRLRRQFPGVALNISLAKLGPSLIKTLAQTLGKMSSQIAPDTLPSHKKDGRHHEESRNTAHPKIVTELLTAFMLPLGEAAEVTSICKNTRDDVLWDDCKTPWRRSPMWLFVRVAIHLIFLRYGLEPSEARHLYKQFMIAFTAGVLAKVEPLLKNDPSCTEWCDLVYAMRAKVFRRVLKLQKPLPRSMQRIIQDLTQDDTLQKAWDGVRAAEASSSRVDLQPLQSLEFDKDTLATLPQLDDFVTSLSKRHGTTKKANFTPLCPIPEFTDISEWFEPAAGQHAALHAACYDQQLSHLPTWLEPKLQQVPPDANTTCAALWRAMFSYENMARINCVGNPEAWSLMVLGVLELWIACDRVACEGCPLLRDYDPGIDVRRLQSLLLPFRPQMERLAEVEAYLSERRTKGFRKDIWTSCSQADTFAVCYFDGSPAHQALRREIMQKATADREAKITEFAQLKKEYVQLMQACNTMECSYISEMLNGQPYPDHSPRCVKCRKQADAENLAIHIHEWPLPTSEEASKNVVFELRVPQWFSIWREATSFVRFNILRCTYIDVDRPGPNSHFPLDYDMHVRHLYNSRLSCGETARIGLLSRVKPQIQTHYKAKKISGIDHVSKILFDNASRWEYYDSGSEFGCFIGAVSPSEGIERLASSMMYQLPADSQAVQKFLYRPPASPDGPPSNTVLATQAECPSHLSLTEYKALGTMPLGHRIQWQNLLLQVTSPAVDFKKPETCKTVLLCMYQAGPPGRAWHRAGHTIPASNEAFVEKMLHGLQQATERIEDNWRCVDELGCYIAIARRILSLSAEDHLKWEALGYLSYARDIALRWVKALKERADASTDREKSVFRVKVARAALVYADTFNFQDKFSTGNDVLTDVITPRENAADFIETCITIQECYPPRDGPEPILYWRWQHLCLRAYPILHRAIVEDLSPALNDAIGRSWVAFNPAGSNWTAPLISGCRHESTSWLKTESLSQRGGKNLSVDYCLVTGELRVNGFPLNRLPSEYEAHPMYARLFGSSVLEVMPGDVPGMVFSGKKHYAGHEVHFSLATNCEGGRDLLVRAVKDGQSWDLADPRLFKGFPHRFVEDYVHWYSHDSKTIEFNPREDPWTASGGSWILTPHGDRKWQLARGDDRILVAPTQLNGQSQTASHMGTILSPLVGSPHLELVYRPSLSLLEIELPRLKLAFHIKRGSTAIRSRQFRGMRVDADQTIGALVGLKNKLVLRGDSEGKLRKVIFPDGPITFEQARDHTLVTISREVAVPCHSFDVDTRLGRLVDNESLESKVLLAYLHALTSFCLPDPLTQRTGTEQALDILRSASVKSFPVLSEQNISMLKTIARLTPIRVYYPECMTEMQSVHWSANLGFMAQHNGFFRAATSLLQSSADRAFLYKVEYDETLMQPHTTCALVRRDEIRSSMFRVSQYGAEEHTTAEDVEYPARDTGQSSTKAGDAYAVADYLLNKRQHLPHTMPSFPKEYIWKYLAESSGNTVHGSSFNVGLGGSEDTPEYDAHWLLDTHHEILAKNILLYHDLFQPRTLPGIEETDAAIWLATLAFSNKANLPMIQLLASMSNVRAMDDVRPPKAKMFSPTRGLKFNRNTLLNELNNDAVYRMFTNCPEFEVSVNKGYDEERRMQAQWRTNCQKALDGFLECAEELWPCARPEMEHHSRRSKWTTYLRPDVATSILHRHTVPWFDNHGLEAYFGRLSGLLPTVGTVSRKGLYDVQSSARERVLVHGQRPGFIGRTDVFLCSPPVLDSFVSPEIISTGDQHTQVSTPSSANWQTALLDGLLKRLDSMAGEAFEREYVSSLRESVTSLATRSHQSIVVQDTSINLLVETHLVACIGRAEKVYSAICGALQDHMDSLFIATIPWEDTNGTTSGPSLSPFCPRLSPAYLLQNIAKGRWKDLPVGWKECIVQYGVSLSQLQRAERMMSATRRGDMAALSNELLNAGHTNWSPTDYPDSLLLEVESGITIRDVQEEIAARMRSPPDSKNSVMQLNMGEGKSSVIVPIVASALADGTSIVRVFVAKPQSKQMLQMLTSKLGGILDRVIYQMPFSRDIQVTLDQVGFIRKLLEECRDEGGVLLVQPEHVLSLQQMGTEFAISPEKAVVARSLNMTRHFLFRTARDIVDESDENFSVKFELVYTMGPQQPVNHSPQRWLVIQEVLGLVQAVAPEVRRQFPDAVEIQDGSSPPASFPRTRVLKGGAMKSILEKLADRICDNSIAGFPISQQTPAVRDAVRTYMTKDDLSAEEIGRVEREGSKGFWTEAVRPTLALLRGLIAGGILTFTLMQKRWRVNYGVTPDRMPPTRLAVPYRAKDQPSPRSEFSHPDVVIILTCLSYYYGGLTDADMFLALDNLLRSDQAEIEYGRWVRGGDVPDKFKTLAGVNPEDREQCVKDVFPHLRLSKAVIDYYLDHIVYPKDMKEFPSKLSSSGWDLAEQRAHPTTGFSGTNDSRGLLPLGMEQLDLEDQKHTNALVMSYLLQPETSVTDITPRTHGSDADALLDHVVALDPPVRVILDVGAQVLELGNHGVACQWLKKIGDNNTQAVVFFNESDELSVVDRSGFVERLQTSPFASQLDACLVFLDEAHTRGTDLKLPTNYRAAVTLGANQTKDGLMQGNFPHVTPLTGGAHTDHENSRMHAHEKARPRPISRLLRPPRDPEQDTRTTPPRRARRPDPSLRHPNLVHPRNVDLAPARRPAMGHAGPAPPEAPPPMEPVHRRQGRS